MKWYYIYKKKKELNRNYSFFLFLAELKARLLFRIEKSVRYKFILTSLALFLFIIMTNYIIIFLQNNTPNFDLIQYQNSTIMQYLQSPLQDPNIAKYINLISVKYLGLHPPDTDSARYFYSTVIQSLAALLAISFSVLLIYLQIGTDKYAIQTIRHTFSNFWAIIVISIFSITMIYSLFELCLIENGSESVTPYYNIPSLIVIFILTIMCIFIMVKFFYVILNTLSPESFIKENCNQIKKSLWLTLLFFQDRVIYYQYLKEQIKKNENIELDSFFPSSDSQNPIRPIKYGLIQDIEIKKLNKCSQLLRKVSSDCRLKIYIPPNWQIKNKNFLLGNVDCSDNETVTEIEKLVQNAYYISNSTCIFDEHTNFSPISSFTTKMIKSSERDISDKALNEFIDVALEYIKYCNELGLVEDISKMDEVALRFSFLNEFFKSIQRISKVSVDESDFESIDLILYKIREIGFEAINSLDARSFRELINFYLWFGDRFENKFTDRVFSETDDLSFRLYFDLKDEKENKKLIQKYGELLETTIYHDLRFANILINQQSNQSKRSLYKLLGLRRDLDEIWDYNEENELELKLEGIEENGNDYHIIKNKIEVIEQKKQLCDKCQLELDTNMYQFGVKLMLNLEKDKFAIKFAQSNLQVITEYFKLNDVDSAFKRITSDIKASFDIEHWKEKIEDYQAHILETDYYERFFILVKALIFKKYNLISSSKSENIYTQQRVLVFETELNKLNKKREIWDTFFKDDSKFFFDTVFEKIKSLILEQEQVLQNDIIKAKLSPQKVEGIISEIISSAENIFNTRRYVKIHKTDDNKGMTPVGTDTLVQKIFIVNDTIDPTTYYDYRHIGRIVGQEMAIKVLIYAVNEIFIALNSAEKKLEFESISFEDLNVAKRELEIKGFNPTTIIASPNLKLNYTLYKLSNTQSSSKDNRYDWLKEVENYNDVILPDGVLIMFDKEHIGSLNIFKKLNPIIQETFDKDALIKKELEDGKILDNQIEERKRELNLMVNIRAFEEVKFEFDNPDAGVIITIKPTSA